MKLVDRVAVEGAGTAWLVFVGCASAALNGAVPAQGWNVFEMAAAFGLALAVAGFASARVSSAHFNPAVTIGFAASGRFPVRDVVPYIAAQTVGALLGTALLAYVASGRPGFSFAVSDFASNGYDEHSPCEYAFGAVAVVECVMTFAFVLLQLVMSRSPQRRKAAPMALGACLAAIYLIAIPVSNGGMNPARSTAPALFVGDWALDQLWLFWAAPMLGGIAAGIAHRLALRLRARGRIRSRAQRGASRNGHGPS
ncbi:MAG: aquaporin [Paraburkholderia tropica]|uniref:MIP family channel protein n=1 Tax=Paraburkholderia tropica TaxID=92647 RepID=A0ABX5MYF1_9BURK|nr:aquaporin [Paraburkholderia tropica]MBB2997977.1 aquaporin Z [Paraburkholderia tropica]MBB6316999.1 aquaporin Z [Paraburkholderia tropica]MDE1142426.1 aquaporin [Paraburkholderia tropica]PXX20567.1 MIP family channel protein [Paraburkholderia tropica]PZW89645.1 MIP family channel protein [Paraburkholderia tropica]